MSDQPHKKYDLVIVGGGLCGLALLHALRDSQRHILLIDRPSGRRHQTQNNRPLVLTHGNICWLSALMSHVAITDLAHPLYAIHLSAQHTFGHSMLDADDVGLPALGHVVPAGQLYQGMMPEQLPPNIVYRPNTSLLAWSPSTQTMHIQQGQQRETIRTCAVVAADGARSTVATCVSDPPEQDGTIYATVLANITAEKGQDAKFRWTEQGTLAWLPTGPKTGSVVVTHHDHPTPTWRQHEPDDLRALQQLWSHHLRWQHAQTPTPITYGTTCFLRETMASSGLFWVGNAAHSMPPVGAQGFNLGCRDVAALAKILLDAPATQSWADPQLAEAYQQARATDCRRTYHAVMQLSKPPKPFGLSITRALALSAIEAIPALKSWIIYQGLGMRG